MSAASSVPPSLPPSNAQFTGWAAQTAKAKLAPWKFTPREWTSHSIQVDVVNCGLCQSDQHLIDGDWGPASQYPIVCGHEIVGKVTHVGHDVSCFKVGDLAGVGWQCGSCMDCQYCKSGEAEVCAKSECTAAGGNRGGFADKWRGDGRHAYKLPSNLNPKFAGPLMCGGITVYSPLVKYSKPGDRVAVVGIGGLGSMAIQFAAKRGCVVTALSRGTGKKDLCLKLGATSYVDSKPLSGTAEEQAAWVKENVNSFDFLIYTPSVTSDGVWDNLLSCMKPFGKIVLVGAVLKPMSFASFGPFLMKRLQVIGSNTGGQLDMVHMLQFAADMKIAPMIEELPFEKINEAIAKMKANKIRFRMVLNN